jgi:hypothetical protein
MYEGELGTPVSSASTDKREIGAAIVGR